MPAALASARCRIPIADLGLWRADQLATPALPAHPCGFAALDAELPGGGWPAAALSELLLREPGCGEIRLLAPALAALGERDLVWVAPPYPPYAPALQGLRLPLARIVWLRPASEADAAWAAEQVLRSGAAGAVLWWSREALPATLRRLHLAAQEGGMPLFALRPWAQQHQSSPAPLRLGLEPLAHDGLRVHVFKRRGPSLAQPIELTLPSPAHGRRVVLNPTVVADVVAGPAPALVAA
jgi:protein ImuA